MTDLVEFRHLKYIVAVAEAANITRVAERPFLAQPSLSKQIKDLEDEIGFPIFVRTREGVRITPPGQMIIALRPRCTPRTDEDHFDGPCSSPGRSASLPARIFIFHQSKLASTLSRRLPICRPSRMAESTLRPAGDFDLYRRLMECSCGLANTKEASAESSPGRRHANARA